jgi:hypothetical protein
MTSWEPNFLAGRSAQSLFSSSYPEDRLNDVVNDRREMFGDIQAAIDEFSGKHHFKPRDTAAAMGQVDDALGDLFYEYEEELRDEISEKNRESD